MPSSVLWPKIRIGIYFCGITLVVLGISCSSDEKPFTMPPPLVEVMTIEKKDVPIELTFVGQTEGSRAVEVRAQVSGILVSRNYEEGEYVQQGQLLFEIEPETYKADLEQALGVMEQARAKFIQAKQNKDRILPLYSKNAVSQKDRDDAIAAYNAAKADLDSANAGVTETKIRLGYAYVTAPVSGYASKEVKTPGNLISAESPKDSLLTVVNQVDPIYVPFSVPSAQYMEMKRLVNDGRLRKEEPLATLVFSDGSKYDAVGKVTFVDKQVNPVTSIVSARAEFPNPKLQVLPGQFARVIVRSGVLVDTILIPQKAIIQSQKGSMVAVLDKEHKVEIRPVTIGTPYQNNFLVYEGLSDGDVIIIEGNNKAVPGRPVRIKDSNAAPPATSPNMPAEEKPTTGRGE